MSVVGLHGAAAANLAAWHRCCTAALGLGSTVADGWWTCTMPAPTIYHSAITVAPGGDRRGRARRVAALARHAEDPATCVVSVCDTWDELDLRGYGLERRAGGTWLARPAGPPPRRAPVPGLEVVAVRDGPALATFEAAMVAGFGARPPLAPHDIHAPGILADPAMHVLAGVLDGLVVGTSMAYVTDVVGVFGVATRPDHRRRGVATAMTAAAIAIAPDRPAVLQPTAAAGPLYRRLGFVELGPFAHWA